MTQCNVVIIYIVDWGLVTQYYGRDFTSAGGEILLNFEVKKIEKRPNEKLVAAFDQNGRVITSKFVLTCGGLMVI